jgi:integrase
MGRSPASRRSALGELWLAEIDRAVRLGKRSPTTAQQYRYRFERHVRDGLGRLRVRELTVARLDRLVTEVHDRFGRAAAKTTRTVLSGMVGLAVRHEALERNPVRDVGRIESESSSARALTVVEAVDLRSKIHSDERASGWDLVDFTDFMPATGLRIGEAAAVTWDALDLDVGLSVKWRPIEHPGRSTRRLRGRRLPVGDLARVPQDRGDAHGRGRTQRAAGGRPARAREGVDDAGQLLRTEGRPDGRRRGSGDLRPQLSRTQKWGKSGG